MPTLAANDSHEEFESGLVGHTLAKASNRQSAIARRQQNPIARRQFSKTEMVDANHHLVSGGLANLLIRFNFGDSACNAKLLQTVSWRPGRTLISVWL